MERAGGGGVRNVGAGWVHVDGQGGWVALESGLQWAHEKEWGVEGEVAGGGGCKPLRKDEARGSWP